MSPILVRPVREQLEHDRIIRLLQAKLKRRGEVIANIGDEQSVPVKIGQMQIYPDLVLTSSDRGRKVVGTIEVETSESVNHLEARAQWAHLGRARVPFHLYVPAGSVDMARRLAADNDVNVSEIWSYHSIGDQTRFTLVHKAAPEPAPRPAAAPKSGTRAASSRAAAAKATPRKRTAAPARKRKTASARSSSRSSAKTAGRAQKRK